MRIPFRNLPVFAEFTFGEFEYQKINANGAVTLPSCNSDGGTGYTFDPYARVTPNDLDHN